jgi:ATP-dependent helicase/nuclease subunit A
MIRPPTTSADAPLPVPAEHLKHKVILASAGSGKTHELSGRYLALLAAGAPPQSILASTFTRLAAGEIRDRLLKRLADSVGDSRKRTELAESLGLPSLTSAQVRSMLSALARNLHLLKAGTLDAFFASVVFGFAIELGLPLGASIVDEQDNQALRLEAVRLMLDEGKPDELIELLRLLSRGESERNVTGTLDRLVRDLYEIWRETPPQAWECVPVIEGELSRTDLVEALDWLATCDVPGDKRFASAREKELHAALAHDWSDFINGGIAKKVLLEDYTYYGKAIPQAMAVAYQPLVQHAVAVIVGRLRDQTLATRHLLAQFERQYAALKLQRRVITFADLTQAMARAERDAAPLTEIFFRLDARLQHLLLDEFQDTSLSQWRALQPLAKEMTDNAPPERTFFCVGDVKQSIYVWRNANPEILEHLPKILPGVQEAALDRSWRSSPIVIDVINTVFLGLKGNAALEIRLKGGDDDDTYAEAARLWRASFNAHEVAERNRALPGYAQMRFGPARTGSGAGATREQKRRRLCMAARLVADLHRDNPHMRIALLTRTNEAVARLLYELGSDDMRVPASGRGGGPLIDAPPVNALLDLLQLADHPDDTVAAFNVARSPLGEALGFTEHAHHGQRRRLARLTRESLLRDGYQRTLAGWVALIAGSCNARELRRAAQAVELAGVHDRRMALGGVAALRPASFVALVEQKDVPDSQPAPVEVMTVHQAKGLEFDAVVLAELGENLSGNNTPPFVFERDAGSGEIKRISRWIGDEVRAHVPSLQPMMRQHRIRTIRESLSLLYVAMTRPKQGLYMIVDPPSEKERGVPRDFGGVLRCALAPRSAAPEQIVFEHGDPEWWTSVGAVEDSGTEAESKPAARISESKIVLAPDPDDAARGEAAVSASMWQERAAARKQASALREQLQLKSPEGSERGSVMHTLFEQIEWLEDFALDDAVLLPFVRSVAPRRDESWHRKQIAAFRGMLKKPEMAAALSRGTSDVTMIRLHRELAYARLVGAGVQTGSIDRLVLRLDARGRATGATVIDFKTDATAAGSPQTQAEVHRAQLQAYRAATSEMFALHERAIAMQVLLVGAGTVVTL